MAAVIIDMVNVYIQIMVTLSKEISDIKSFKSNF